MRKWYYQGLVALACAGVVGCAEQVDTAKQAQLLAELRAGQTVLACREPCLAAWRDTQPQAAQLDAGARWQDLALLVMRIGYQDDLSLYYLGRAAEGIGYRAAAAGYYRQSAQFSRTAASCDRLSRICGGVGLPRAALVRAAAIDRELGRTRARRPGPEPRGSATPATAPDEMEATAPTPLPRPAGPAASEYIEPPPARR
jgi:hypothetical protein